MGVQLNREIKAYCQDFEPVRQVLRGSGAVFVETKEQVDHYYDLRRLGEEEGRSQCAILSSSPI